MDMQIEASCKSETQNNKEFALVGFAENEQLNGSWIWEKAAGRCGYLSCALQTRAIPAQRKDSDWDGGLARPDQGSTITQNETATASQILQCKF